MTKFLRWVNRKDFDGKNVFEGGFLGLDNIGIFNRSEPLPTGGVLEQADSTGWMAFYSLNMLNIALELAKHRRIYEDIASKFFEHFIFISDAMTYKGEQEGGESSLWNEEDGLVFFPPRRPQSQGTDGRWIGFTMMPSLGEGPGLSRCLSDLLSGSFLCMPSSRWNRN